MCNYIDNDTLEVQRFSKNNKNPMQREIATMHTKEAVDILWNQQKCLTKKNKAYQS